MNDNDTALTRLGTGQSGSAVADIATNDPAPASTSSTTASSLCPITVSPAWRTRCSRWSRGRSPALTR